MDHMKLSDELRNQLLENAAWGKAGITPRLDETGKKDTGASKGDKGKDKDDPEARDYERGGDRKGDEGAGTKKGDKPDYTTDQRKGDKSKTHAGKDFEESTIHVCPLCVAELDEAIDEERLLEHLNVVVGLVDRLSQLHEGDEDIDTVIDETIEELLFADLEEE